MGRRILLLGHTGKMGLALTRVLSPDNDLVGRNSKDFDASDFAQVEAIIAAVSPEMVINTVSLQGIDRCELEPEKAFRLNTLFPGHLATVCEKRQITFAHFSSDAVFSDAGEDFCTERDLPAPLNMYGVTKYGGDCLVNSNCLRHYIFRLPILFGESRGAGQFVEKMLTRLRTGDRPVRVAADIISSPSYSLDIAVHVRTLLLNHASYGTYHLANKGRASLYDLMVEITANCLPGVQIEKGSYLDFPFVGRKNLNTPLRSIRTENLRPWREAVKEYCCSLTNGWVDNG